MAKEVTTQTLSIDPNNYEFYYDNLINTREIYDQIVDVDSNDQNLYKELLKNYVRPGDAVLKSISKREGVKASKNVKFDKMTGLYKSTIYGYVFYKKETEYDENNRLIKQLSVYYNADGTIQMVKQTK